MCVVNLIYFDIYKLYKNLSQILLCLPYVLCKQRQKTIFCEIVLKYPLT